jgi:hypothetical protein
MGLKRSASIVAIATASAAIVACGGTTKTVIQTTPVQQSTQTATAAMTQAQAGQAYERAVAPANAAGNALSAKIETYTDSTTGAQVTADAQPFTQAMTALNGKLLSLANAYPPAAADLKALVNAYNPIIGDLQSARAATVFSASSWVQQLTTDLSKTTAAVAVVRSDLGLPPAKG